MAIRPRQGISNPDTSAFVSYSTELDYTPVYVRVAGHGTACPRSAWRSGCTGAALLSRLPGFHHGKPHSTDSESDDRCCRTARRGDFVGEHCSQNGTLFTNVPAWPTMYTDDWDRLFGSAVRRMIASLGGEARHTLQRLLRSENEKIQADIGKFLTRLSVDDEAAQERKADRTGGRESKYAPYVAFLETLDDDQARAFLDEYVVRRMAELREAQPAVNSSAGQGVGQFT